MILQTPRTLRGVLLTLMVGGLLGCASAGQPADTRLAAQPPAPPSIAELTIESNGSRMAGLAYLAAGKGPHPTVVLLHGYPGNEKNLDVAQALRRNGWNVVFFHYRGAWGSEGEFSLRNAEQDVQVVLNYLMDETNAKRLRTDPNRISTVGHSMGGHMAIAGILDHPSVRCAVTFDGANMGANQGQGLFADPRISAVWRAYSDSLFMLNGWSGAKAAAEMQRYGKQLDLVPRSTKIGARPVLLIGADSKVIPLATHIKPLQQALAATPGSRIQYLLIADDHSFSASRLELIDATVDFLDSACRQ